MDNVVVITGASAGIGAELARQLAAKGAKVVLAARRKAELDSVAAEIGTDAFAVVTDVTKRSDVEQLCRAALDHFGRIDVWVNNAGRGISRSVAELTDDEMDAMWRDNMKSVLYGIQAVLPHFKSRNQGQIVNLSSGLSRAPLAPARAAYGAVKSAVNMLSASLRVELRPTHPGISHGRTAWRRCNGFRAQCARRRRRQPQDSRRATTRRSGQGHRCRHRAPEVRGVHQPVHRRDYRPVPARSGRLRGGSRIAAELNADRI